MSTLNDPYRSMSQAWQEANAVLSDGSVLPAGSPEEVSFGDATAASFRLSPTQRALRGGGLGLLDAVGRAGAVMLPEWAGGVTADEMDAIGPVNPEPFNLEDSLRRLQPEPQDMAIRLLENGSLDDVTDRQQFDAILTDALGVQRDLQALQQYDEQEGFIKSMGASLTGGIADPIYLIPYGGMAARGAMTTTAAARFLAAQGARAAVGGAAINLGAKKLVDAASYDLTDLPGATDDMVVAAIGGGFGAAMPVLGYASRQGLASTVHALGGRGISLPGGLPAWAQRWSSQAHLEELFKKMNTLETPKLRLSATGEGADAALRQAGGTARFDNEWNRSGQMLDDLIRDARAGRFYPDLSLAPLLRGVDDPIIAAKVDKLKRLYKKHRASIRKGGTGDPDEFLVRIHQHTAQDDYDRLRIIRSFFETDPALQSLPTNPLAAIFLEAGDLLPTGQTPAARMSKVANLMYDLTRALSGSFSDLTERDLQLLGGLRSSAEAIKDNLDLMLAARNREMLAIMRKHGMIGIGRSRIPENNKVLSEAVNIIFDRQARIAGPPRSAAAVEIADVMEKYFRQVNDELVAAGLFDANPFGMSHYVPMSIDETKVSANEAGFRAAAKAQFRFLDDAQRPDQIRPDALARAFDRTTDKKIRSQIVATVRAHVGDPSFKPKNGSEIRARLEEPSVSVLPPESAFPPRARTAYADSLDAIYTEGADDLYKTLVDPASEMQFFESITTAGSPSAFKERTFTVVSPEMREFLITDPVTLMRRYAAQVHGQVGIARAAQLNPEVFNLMKVVDGGIERPVKTADELLGWLLRAENAFQTMFDKAGVKASDSARKAIDRMITDQRAIVKRLIGQSLYKGGARPPEEMMWSTRQMSRAAMVVNGGMMGVSNILDMSGKLAWTVMHPVRGFPIMFETFAPIANRMRRRDLEFLNMASQLSVLPRETSEYNLMQRGFGTGAVRTFTGRIDEISEGASRQFGRVIGLNLVNTINGRWGAAIAMDEMVTLAKRLVRAQASGAADPIKAAKLTESQLGRLSRLGIRPSNAESVLRQIHGHGVHWDQGRANAIPFDEFLASDRPVNPMFEEWRGALKERRAFLDNISNEARRVLNVTPGVADRPVLEDTMPMMRIVNQFASFAYAYNRQKLRPMFQGPLGEQGVNLATHVMFGWMMYASKNALTDRKQFSESVAELVENPRAAAWGAAQEGMLVGNFMRAVGYYDRAAMPLGISTSQITGQTVAGGTFGAVTRQQQDRGMSAAEIGASYLGAGPQLLLKAADSVMEKNDARAAYMRAQALPLQNLVWARILNKAGVSDMINEEVGFVPGFVPSDLYRPQRPTLRAR